MRAVLIGPNGHGSLLGELKEAYRLETVAHFAEPGLALAFVETGVQGPEIVVADVSRLADPAADRALVDLLDAVAVRWPPCRMAAVLGEPQRYLTGELQHARARAFHRGPGEDDPPDLIQRLATYLDLKRRQELQAPVVLALSAKGGVGKTTLIANLGAALAARHGLRVAVVDGDLTRGDLARLLGVKPTATLLDLAADGGREGVAALLDRSLLPLEGGRLSLLAAPPGGQAAAQPWTALTVRHAQAILAALRERFDLVLLDTPPDLYRSSPFPAAVLTDGLFPFVALVIVQPQPLEREGCQQVLDLLAAHRAVQDPIRGIVIDRSPAAANARQLARVLGVEVLASIPYDPKIATARQATDLVYDYRRPRLRPAARAYAGLARWLAEGSWKT